MRLIRYHTTRVQFKNKQNIHNSSSSIDLCTTSNAYSLYSGIFMVVNKNPHVQRFDLKDTQLDATYEIDLTSDELETNRTFCKHLSRTISG